MLKVNAKPAQAAPVAPQSAPKAKEAPKAPAFTGAKVGKTLGHA